MTGNQINSFVGNLVEMAKAYEELPDVRAQLAGAVSERDQCYDTIAEREASILALKAELAEAHALRQKVEAERDEAIGSFLAADDRADKILAFVKATFGSAGALIQAVEPSPVAKVEPEQTTKPQEDIQPSPEFDHAGYRVDPLAEAPLHPAPQGESVVGEPTAPSHYEPVPVPPVNAPTYADMTAHDTSPSPAPEVAPTPTPTPVPPAPTETESEASAYEPPTAPDASLSFANQPYLGRRYVDVPGYVSIDDWIAGGGTEYNYYLRP